MKPRGPAASVLDDRGAATASGSTSRFEACFAAGALVDKGEILGRLLPEGLAGACGPAPRAGTGVRLARERGVYESLAPGFPILDDGALRLDPLVHVADDEMAATITLRPRPETVPAPTCETIVRMLGEAGVAFGVLENVLADTLRRHAERPAETISGVVARGKPCIAGTDGGIRFTVDLAARALRTTPSGRVDFHRLNLCQDVRAGEVLAVRVPSTKGSAGTTVTGKVLMAQPGRERTIAVGENVKTPAGTLEFRATCDGIFFVTQDRLRVLKAYDAEGDVGLATGDIETRHAVNVRGSIRSTFSVRAGGNIRVGEHAEDAIVESGASIDVKGGICHQALGSMRARGNVRAKYALNADIQAQGSIELDDSALHSCLVAGDAITLLKGRGVFMGGQAIAANRVEVNVAGSKAGVLTVLRVGHDQQSIEPVEQKLRLVAAEMAHVLSMAGGDLLKFARDAAPEPATGKIKGLVERWRLLERRKQALWERRDRILAASAEQMSGNPFILVRRTLHAGVRLVIGKALLLVTAAIPGGRFVFCQETGAVQRE